MQTTKILTTKDFEQWLAEQADIIVRYRQIEKSDILAEYTSLKQVIESAEFQAKKKELTTTRYADTSYGKTMAAYSQLKWKMSVLMYNWFKKEAWKEKAEVAQYLQLQEEIQAPDFQQANAFWKNSKRWFTTPESEQEKRYQVLAKHADILFFHLHTNEEIAALESYQLVWSDEFDGSKMGEAWATGFLYPSLEFKANHSHVSELQAYTKGQNTLVGGSVMYVQTKKDKTTAPAWHPQKGMILHPFVCTSDVWHTVQAVAPAAGVLQAKVNAKGAAKHILSLVSDKGQKALPILPAKLNKGYAIYTLVWNEKEVISYVNNVEVSRTKNPLAGEALHLLLRSYLPSTGKASNAELAIDWIRVYTHA